MKRRLLEVSRLLPLVAQLERMVPISLQYHPQHSRLSRGTGDQRQVLVTHTHIGRAVRTAGVHPSFVCTPDQRGPGGVPVQGRLLGQVRGRCVRVLPPATCHLPAAVRRPPAYLTPPSFLFLPLPSLFLLQPPRTRTVVTEACILDRHVGSAGPPLPLCISRHRSTAFSLPLASTRNPVCQQGLLFFCLARDTCPPT